MQTVPRFFADDTALLTTENNVDKNKKYRQNAGIHFNNWRFAKHL